MSKKVCIAFIIWILSLIGFLAGTSFVNSSNDTVGVIVCLSSLVIGILSFVALVLTSILELIEDFSGHIRSTIPLSIVVIGLSVLTFLTSLHLVSISAKRSNIARGEYSTKFKRYSPTITNVKDSSESNISHPSVSSVPSPKKVVAQDPIITCNFPYSGDLQLKQSECASYIDCQVGEEWIIYSSRKECEEGQEAYWKDYWEDFYDDLADKYTSDYDFSFDDKSILFPIATFKVQQIKAPSFKVPQIEVPSFDGASLTLSPEECRSAVLEKYKGLLQSCTQYSAFSSAHEACISIYESSQKQELEDCL